jgi:predicted GNAT family acetyltransferase
MDQGIYRLDHLAPRESVPGEMITAGPEDWSTLRAWAKEFFAEALAKEKLPLDEFLRWVERRFSEGAYRMWFNGTEVCAWAGTSGQTKNGTRIGPVYTPSRFRRQGYASALTWELSSQVLKSGKKFCFLYTDLLNGTSNGIYQKIGYRQILQSQHWSF